MQFGEFGKFVEYQTNRELSGGQVQVGEEVEQECFESRDGDDQHQNLAINNRALAGLVAMGNKALHHLTTTSAPCFYSSFS